MRLRWSALALACSNACGELRPEADPPQPIVEGRPVETICAGEVTGPRNYFVDQDRDGFGVGDSIGATCADTPPPGRSFVSGDCNDADGAHWDDSPLYRDNDGDGVGNFESGQLEGCVFPTAGYSSESGDCDDSDASKQERSFLDLDGDGWGSEEVCVPKQSPEPDVAYIQSNGDCDDADSSINPGATDVAGDAVDTDCNGWGFPTERETCELRDLDTWEPARVGEAAYWYCVPIELTVPNEVRPECEFLPDPIIVATRRVQMAPSGVMYDVKVGNTGGASANVVLRETDEYGHAVDRAPIALEPLGISEWLGLSLAPRNGANHTRLELLNADGTPDCSLVDSSAEFVLVRPHEVP